MLLQRQLIRIQTWHFMRPNQLLWSLPQFAKSLVQASYARG